MNEQDLSLLKLTRQHLEPALMLMFRIRKLKAFGVSFAFPLMLITFNWSQNKTTTLKDICGLGYGYDSSKVMIYELNKAKLITRISPGIYKPTPAGIKYIDNLIQEAQEDLKQALKL